MEAPARVVPKLESTLSTDNVIKQLELSGINLGLDPRTTLKNYADQKLIPAPEADRYPAWVVQRITAIQDQLAEGKTFADLRNEISKERRRFLSQVTDLNSMMRVYDKFSSHSFFGFIVSLGVLIVFTGLITLAFIDPKNPVLVAGENTVNTAVAAGKTAVKIAATPVGQAMVTVIKASKPDDTKSADPLGLTNIEKEKVVIPENIVQLDNSGNINLSNSEIIAGQFVGSGESLIDLPAEELTGILSFASLPWSDITSNFLAGPGIRISPSNTTDELTFENTDLGSSQFIFKNIAVSGQSTLVSDTNSDALTLAAGTNITLTTDATTDTLTISSSGGSSNADTLDSLDSTAFLRTIGGTISGGLNISGDLDVAGHSAFGSNASVNTSRVINLSETMTTADNYGIYMDLTKSAGANNLYGIYSKLTTSVNGSGGIYGAWIEPTYNLSSGSISQLIGTTIQLTSLGGTSGNITFNTIGLEVKAAWFGSAVPDTTKGIEIADLTYPGTDTAYGILIADQGNCATTCHPIAQAGSTGTNYFIATSVFGGTASGNDTLYSAVVRGSLCVDDGTPSCPAGPTSGGIYVDNSVGTGNVSAFDIAEYYPASQEVEKGEVVSIDDNGTTVSRSSAAYDSKVLGIVSTDPAFVIDENNITFGKDSGKNFDSRKPYIALAGRVPVKVSSENGNINPGDYLTSSSTQGVAMKATKTGPTIGKALESYSGNEIGRILVFVQTSYYVNFADAPNYTINSQSDFVTKFISKSGEAVLSKVTAAFANIGKLVFGEIAVEKSSKSAGSSVIAAGNSEVFVSSNKVRSDSLINLTADSEPDGILYVKEKRSGDGFVVGIKRLNQTSAKEIRFNWFILNQE